MAGICWTIHMLRYLKPLLSRCRQRSSGSVWRKGVMCGISCRRRRFATWKRTIFMVWFFSSFLLSDTLFLYLCTFKEGKMFANSLQTIDSQYVINMGGGKNFLPISFYTEVHPRQGERSCLGFFYSAALRHWLRRIFDLRGGTTKQSREAIFLDCFTAFAMTRSACGGKALKSEIWNLKLLLMR